MADLTININGSPTPVYLGESTALASAKATAATSAAADALASKEVAQAAALSLANVFQTTAAGLAAVGPNETFWVFSGGLLSLYRDVAGSAVLLDSLPLSTAVLAKRAFGRNELQSVVTQLAGSDIPATIGPVYIGHDTSSADAITIDTAAAFPPGIAFRRSRGTPGSPTTIGDGDQIGYLDFRGYNSGKFYNAASIDVKVYGTIPFGADEPPRTAMFFFITGNNDQAKEAFRLVPLGNDDGFAGWFGALDPSDPEGGYLPPAGNLPRLFVTTHLNEWSTIIEGRPASGNSFGQRIDINGETSADSFLGMYSGPVGSRTLKASICGDGMGVFPRMRIGIDSDPPFGAPSLAIQNTVNDYCFTAASIPASGPGYAARFHTLGETASDWLLGLSSGAGTGSMKFRVFGDGTADLLTSLAINGTKVLGAQGAAVADATDAASAITQLNALLARMRAHGLIAT